MTKTVYTTKLRDGRVVLAKVYNGSVCALTYANLTQARKKAAELGEGWEVTGLRPYYVTWIKTVPRTEEEIRNFDITDKVCSMFNEKAMNREEAWPMYSFDRAAYLLWNAIGRGMYANGWTMEEIKDWMQSKEARWALDARLGVEIEALGAKFAETAEKVKD